jgi:hypothetical protein
VNLPKLYPRAAPGMPLTEAIYGSERACQTSAPAVAPPRTTTVPSSTHGRGELPSRSAAGLVIGTVTVVGGTVVVVVLVVVEGAAVVGVVGLVDGSGGLVTIGGTTAAEGRVVVGRLDVVVPRGGRVIRGGTVVGVG